ncbi:MAG TPA: hypothetical protein VF534_27110 [Paraburkholderia sp.]
MSENLKAFLSAWIEWVDAGAAEGKPFARRFGLCSNLNDWTRPLDGDVRWACEKELDRLFEVDGLDQCHPFGIEEYFEARGSETQHLDAKRLAWVRSKVAQFEAA